MNTTVARTSARSFTASPLFEGLARTGYAARGVIYILVGALAFRLAQGVGGPPASQQGALRTIAHQPFGHLLLVLMAIGLAGYAIWRAAEALIGETPEAGKHSALDRLGAVGSAVAYGSFCALAIGLLQGSSGGGHSPQKATAGVLDWPAGREVVGAAGIVFLIVAGYQAYLGLSRKFLEDSKTGDMGPGIRRGFTAVGVSGLLARAVAFGVIGIFVLKAARDYNPKDAVGLDGALGHLSAYGTTALVVVAVGLVAFGLYSLADARYRKI